MTIKNRSQKKKLSEQAIDTLVTTQADDDRAWEAPIVVRKNKSISLSIPTELAARASFLARVHREKDVQQWVARVLRERIELEESAFATAKRDLAPK